METRIEMGKGGSRCFLGSGVGGTMVEESSSGVGGSMVEESSSGVGEEGGERSGVKRI